MPSIIARPSRRTETSRRSQTCVASKLECAAQAQILAQKRRIPLATKSNINGNVVAASTKISLPRTLSRPVVGEVEVDSLLDAYPHLAGIPADYIRDCLPLSAMRSALQAVEMSVPTSSLPKELEILTNDMVSAACPTHMFAVYGDASASFGQRPRLTLFPAHDLIFRMHCTKLPALPTSRPSASSSHAALPVVLMRLPSPETFSLLHSYLYTQQPAALLASLAPQCKSDMLHLATHANKIHGLWRNACALGVVDAPLYDAIDASWERTIAAMQACS
ncbi:hypothetical protein DFH07DRAFT_951026 [Mycena maculata]|uniref:Uncharacterized protein n=1 Tax=Mycena maculata TaxID=230809 RepID=A0AAD7K423_9AGAR|nr:hypothetical protein DFH07DRAFT_951026 [Mycena maculata]